ncbi:MAG: dephospho-CoA kinase [Ignavibacteriae bacterium]|nr:MAG: dephospho-CoA kinase [Ignavibacteriota bacterium]
MNSLVIGITGGIGSGKSTVSKFFANEGYTVLLADDIAKSIMVKDQSVVQKIIAEFGEKAFVKNKLNRKFLAKEVFNNPKKIEKLNAIVHPPTISLIKNEIQKLNGKESLIFVEAALIFEAKMENLFDYILLVTADEDIRIDRICKRDNVKLSEIKKRIENQIPEKVKKGLSDFTIENNLDLNELKNKTLFFLELFKNISNDKVEK